MSVSLWLLVCSAASVVVECTVISALAKYLSAESVGELPSSSIWCVASFIGFALLSIVNSCNEAQHKNLSLPESLASVSSMHDELEDESEVHLLSTADTAENLRKGPKPKEHNTTHRLSVLLAVASFVEALQFRVLARLCTSTSVAMLLLSLVACMPIDTLLSRFILGNSTPLVYVFSLGLSLYGFLVWVGNSMSWFDLMLLVFFCILTVCSRFAMFSVMQKSTTGEFSQTILWRFHQRAFAVRTFVNLIAAVVVDSPTSLFDHILDIRFMSISVLLAALSVQRAGITHLLTLLDLAWFSPLAGAVLFFTMGDSVFGTDKNGFTLQTVGTSLVLASALLYFIIRKPSAVENQGVAIFRQSSSVTLFSVALMVVALCSLTVDFDRVSLKSSGDNALSLELILSGGVAPILGERWQERLSPLRVESTSDAIWVIVNIGMIAGYADLPPLYSGLPCLARIRTPHDLFNLTSPASNLDDGNCRADWSRERLQLPRSRELSVTLSVQDASTGSVMQQKTVASGLSLVQVEKLEDFASRSSAKQQCAASCLGGGGKRCFLAAASAVCSMVAHLYVVVRAERLEPLPAYFISLRLANGTHMTAWFQAPVVQLYSQFELFSRERLRVTRYYDSLFDHRSTRELAPFERASLPSGGVCSKEFQDFVLQYRTWHERQIKRLQAVGDSSAALRALLTVDQEPIRLIISHSVWHSGISDRTVGLLGLYTMAMLTRRVLLVADDWQDIYLATQFSLQVNYRIIAPALDHADLQDVSTVLGASFEGPPVDNLTGEFPMPISRIYSIRGLQMRFLHDSVDHRGQLQNLGLTSETIFGCVYHSFLIIRSSVLTSRVEYESVTTTLLHSDNFPLGIQIRTFDADTSANGQLQVQANIEALLPVKEFFRCAQEQSDAFRGVRNSRESIRRPVWFLMTDNTSISAAAEERWGAPSVNYSSANPGVAVQLINLRIPSLLGHAARGDPSLQFMFTQHAYVEQTLFSFCNKHIITKNSGFGRVPSALGMVASNVIRMPSYEVHRREVPCLKRDDGSSIFELGLGGHVLENSRL